MTRVLLVLAAIVAVATSVAGAQNAFPSHIELPDDFQPEGIAIAGNEFFVGSIPTGTIYHGDLRTGEGTELVVHTGPGRDRNEGRSRSALRRWRRYRRSMGLRRDDRCDDRCLLVRDEPPTTFVNDVVVTKRGRVVHRLAERGPVSRAARPGRPSGTARLETVDARRRLRAGNGVQHERDRRDTERQDARDRPVEHGEALHA